MRKSVLIILLAICSGTFIYFGVQKPSNSDVSVEVEDQIIEVELVTS